MSQDATARPKALGTKLEDGERVVITEWRFAPGAETGWHRHGLDYVVVYRTPARLTVEGRERTVTVDVAEGTSYFRRAGTEHNIINAGDGQAVFVEIELKEVA